GAGLARGAPIARALGMRTMLALLLLTAGCVDLKWGPWTDPCGDHGNSGGLFGNDCSCPLLKDLNLQLEDPPCTMPGLSGGDEWIAPFSCPGELEPPRWICHALDLAAPTPYDLSTFDAALGDGGGD